MKNILSLFIILCSSLSYAQDFVSQYPMYSFTCYDKNNEVQVGGAFLPGGDGCCGTSILRSTVNTIPGQYVADVGTHFFSSQDELKRNITVISWESRPDSQYVKTAAPGKYLYGLKIASPIIVENQTKATGELSMNNQGAVKNFSLECSLSKFSILDKK